MFVWLVKRPSEQSWLHRRRLPGKLWFREWRRPKTHNALPGETGFKNKFNRFALDCPTDSSTENKLTPLSLYLSPFLKPDKLDWTIDIQHADSNDALWPTKKKAQKSKILTPESQFSPITSVKYLLLVVKCWHKIDNQTEFEYVLWKTSRSVERRMSVIQKLEVGQRQARGWRPEVSRRLIWGRSEVGYSRRNALLYGLAS